LRADIDFAIVLTQRRAELTPYILKKFSAISLCSLLVMGAVNATAHADGVAAGVRVSSQGFGLELVGSLTERLNVRAGGKLFYA